MNRRPLDYESSALPLSYCGETTDGGRQRADGVDCRLRSTVCRLPSKNTCPGSDSNRDALRHHPLKMACLPVSPPGQSQCVHLRVLHLRSTCDPPTTGATGFEPATSRVTVECSNQTELRPLQESRTPLCCRTTRCRRRAALCRRTPHSPPCASRVAPTGVEPVSAP